MIYKDSDIAGSEGLGASDLCAKAVMKINYSPYYNQAGGKIVKCERIKLSPFSDEFRIQVILEDISMSEPDG